MNSKAETCVASSCSTKRTAMAHLISTTQDVSVSEQVPLPQTISAMNRAGTGTSKPTDTTSIQSFASNQIWLVDFEFNQPDGGTPCPICMVMRNFKSRQTKRVWLWGEYQVECPVPVGSDVLYVAYLASAELSCHLALGWKLPIHVLDLYVEFRSLTCGLGKPQKHRLLDCLHWFGLYGIDGVEKIKMRQLAIRGGPYTEEERVALLDYCESDVVALAELLPKMWPHIDLPRALIRGRYMKAVARVERVGIPIDVPSLDRIKTGWVAIKRRLIDEVDKDYSVYDGTTFKSGRWAAWCESNGISWPRLESGALDLKRETFSTMSKTNVKVEAMHELRKSLSELRLNALTVGQDGRNRYMAGVVGTKTGRNAPSSQKSVFGPAQWIRYLIKPSEGKAIAYIDWSQQELGIAAKLSGDEMMQKVYRDSDPYLAFARMAGAVPPGATKKTHPKERAAYKVCALGVLMGMGAESLGAAAGSGEAFGRRLLRQHKELFPHFWSWSDDQENRAMLGETLTSAYGWQIQPVADGPRTYRNFSLQANGAEMMRLATIAIVERDIKLCASVHDAFLVEAPVKEIHDIVAITRDCMAAASRAVLAGFQLETEAEIICYPNRFSCERGDRMWRIVNRLLTEQESLQQFEAPGTAH
jgi:DNA polymerase I